MKADRKPCNCTNESVLTCSAAYTGLLQAGHFLVSAGPHILQPLSKVPSLKSGSFNSPLGKLEHSPSKLGNGALLFFQVFLGTLSPVVMDPLSAEHSDLSLALHQQLSSSKSLLNFRPCALSRSCAWKNDF